MRRAAALCICVLLLLTGCAKKTAKVENEGFSCNVQAKWEGEAYGLFLEMPGGGICKVTLTEGKFKNMAFTLDGEEVRVQYLGMEYTLPDGFAGQSIVAAFKEVFQALKRSGEEQTVDAGDSFTLDTGLGPAEITVRPDGFPTKIVLPERDAELSLSDFNYLG